ncbi:hypothetical protein MBLNU459_g3139t1 [Dothideomycetes sp. NU459]
MLSKSTIAAIFGLLSSGALAAPLASPWSATSAWSSPKESESAWSYTKQPESTSASASWTPISYSFAGPAPTEVSADGDKFRYPLSNEFPTPSNAEIAQIEQAAGGDLPSAAPPPGTISADSLNSLRLIAFNELFEVAFFTSLLSNITNSVPGYEVPAGLDRDFVIETIRTVQAQEQLHALLANGGLASQNAAPIQPCEYVFPTTDLAGAIGLAATFTDVVLGTLGDVQTIAANAAGDRGLIRGFAAVIGQEGEQNGFYRVFQGKRPSAQPFLTVGAREFAFTALQQNFVVPGSCPNIADIKIPTIAGALNLLTAAPQPKDSQLQFSFATESFSAAADYRLVLVNGVSNPIVESLENASYEGGVVTFEAEFPFATDLLYGLTIASVIPASAVANLTDVDSVAAASLFGPALIEVL